MTYYGVTFNSGNIGGDFYLNLFLMGFVEIPGLFLGLWLIGRFGRRKSNSGTMIVAGVACLSTIPTAIIGSASKYTYIFLLFCFVKNIRKIQVSQKTSFLRMSVLSDIHYYMQG